MTVKSRRSSFTAAVREEADEYSHQIVNHPDFPRLLARFISDCDDLDDESTVNRQEAHERKNQY